MAVLRVKLIPEFYFGDDAILLSADAEGIGAFERALFRAMQKSSLPAPLISGGMIHEFAIGGSEARVDFEGERVAWCLPAKKASEILDKLATLKSAPGPSHHYVDMDSPAKMLILSVDEYLDSPIFDSPEL